jgi:Ca2+-transporting ATPase
LILFIPLPQANLSPSSEALRGDPENTPLQLKLNALAELIAKLGSAAGLILFTALMIRYFVQLGTGVPER